MIQPYQPNDLPLGDLDATRLLPLVGTANGELARYDSLLQTIPNPMMIITPLMRQEAILSSKIEGTQATIDEVLESEVGIVKEGTKGEDIQEINNYYKALSLGYDHLQQAPITLSFIRELHKVLLDSSRGRDKTPGRFRDNQNWIGTPFCSIDQASFIPPSPMQLDELLEKWHNYLEGDDIDPLIQTAIVHAQFELIHPFKDGNGRIGRILIPLFLYKKKLLIKPVFYLCAYLEANRDHYYARLQGISEQGDWNGWLEFFLKAIIDEGKQNNRKLKSHIRSLRSYENNDPTNHPFTLCNFSIGCLV